MRAALGLGEPRLVVRGWTWTLAPDGQGALVASDGETSLPLAYQGGGVFLAPSHPAYRFAFTLDRGTAPPSRSTSTPCDSSPRAPPLRPRFRDSPIRDHPASG